MENNCNKGLCSYVYENGLKEIEIKNLKEENEILKEALKFAMEEKVFQEFKRLGINDEIGFNKAVNSNIEYYMFLVKDEKMWERRKNEYKRN